MQLSKKIFTWFSLIVMMSLAVSCTSRVQPAATKQETIEITIGHSWGKEFDKDLKEILIAPFEASHPGIKVNVKEIQDIGWSKPESKYVSMLTGADAPDLIILDRGLVYEYAKRKALTDLNAYIRSSQLDSSDYYARAWEECMYDGSSYCLPWGMDSVQMLYNKKMMADAGLDPEKPPVTIEELDQMNEKLTKLNDQGRITQVGFIPWRFVEGGLFTIGTMFGGNWESRGEFTPNDPKNVKALEWVLNSFKKHDSLVWSEFLEQKTTDFENGKLAFMFATPWYAHDHLSKNKGITFDWGIAPLPAAEGEMSRTFSWGSAVAITMGSQYPKEAWELLQFMNHIEGSTLWTKEMMNRGSVSIAALPSVNEQTGLSKNEIAAPFIQSLDNLVSRPAAFSLIDYWQENDSIIHKMFTKEQTPQQLMDDWKSRVDKIASN